MTNSVFVLGQKKGGSTSLHSLLSAIFLLDEDLPKEPDLVRKPVARLVWELSTRASGRVLLDGSTTYSSRHNAARVARFLSGRPFTVALMVVRPERERVVSHFHHSLRNGEFSGCFAEFLDSDEYRAHCYPAEVIELYSSALGDRFTWFSAELLLEPRILEDWLRQHGLAVAKVDVDLSRVRRNSRDEVREANCLIRRFAGSWIWLHLIRRLVPRSIRTRFVESLPIARAAALVPETRELDAMLLARGIDPGLETLARRCGQARLAGDSQQRDRPVGLDA